jgi:hypothetical protein
MTAPIRRNKLCPPDPDVRKKSGAPHATKGTILRKAQDAWRHRPAGIAENLSIPHWYAGLYGVPNWLLRQSCFSPKMDEKRRALALLVRMNYILDFHHQFNLVDRTSAFFCLPARRLRVFCRVYGPIYSNGSYQSISIGMRMNTSFALSSDYNWKRALACTVGNFVHLAALVRKGGVSIAELGSLSETSPVE